MQKRTKRILVVMTATTMTLGSGLTAMAAPSDTKPADSTITGGGDLDYVDTSTVYEVTLPTAGALDFVIDPQGLTSLKNGESAKLDDLLGNSSIVTKEGAGAYIKNESSIGVKVTVKMNITDTNDTEVTPVDTLEAVTANTTTNICLLAIPSSNSPADVSGYEASNQGIVINSLDSTSTTDFSFVLDKASYSIKKAEDGTLSYAKDTTENNYDAASFKLGGKANGKADWSAYTGASKKEIGVSAVFSVADAAEADVVGTDYTAHGLMDLGSVKTVTVAPAEAAPSIASATATFSKASGATITVDLGKGNKSASGIDKIATIVNGTEHAWVASDYTLSGTTLTIKPSAAISGLAVGQKRTIKITFNDTAKTAPTLELTIAE